MSAVLSLEGEKGFFDLSLGDNAAIPLSLSVKDFDIILGDNNRTQFLSYTISFPYYSNEENLKHLIDRNSKDGVDIICNSSKAILQRGSFCRRGTLHIDDYDSITVGCEKHFTINSQFTSGLANLDFPDNICQLDLGTFEFTRGNVESKFNYGIYPADENGQNGVTVFLGNFGGLDTLNYVPIECIGLGVFHKAIIEALENYLGIKIESKLFKTTWFRRQFTTFGNKGEFNNIIYSATTTDQLAVFPFYIFDFSSGVPLWSETVAVGANYNLNSIRPNEDGLYTFCLEVNVTSINTYANVNVNPDGGTYPLELGTNTIQVELNLITDIGVSFTLHGDFVTEGMTVSLKKKADELTEGAIIDVASSLKCLTITEYFNDLADRYNLVFFYDDKRECLIIDPECSVTLPAGEYVEGFYYGKEKAEDWTDKIVHGSTTGELNFTSLKKTLAFGYKENDSDEIKPTDFLSAERTLCNKYENGTTPLEVEESIAVFNQPLPDNLIGAIPDIPNIPTSYEEVGEKVNLDCMATFYHLGNANGGWTWYNSLTKLIFYPYATMLDTDIGVNLGFETTDGVEGLIDLFFSKKLEIYDLGRRVRKTILLCESDLVDLVDLFRKPKYFEDKYEGNGYYILEEIGQFNVNGIMVVEATFVSIDHGVVEKCK